MAKWTASGMPDQTGRTAIVTGASSGIGAEAAVALALKGARVVLAVRSRARGDAVRARIMARKPDADPVVALCDMADLASVRAFAERIGDTLPAVDVLMNNAGLGFQPNRSTTKDGFELQFGTNHLGPFALTGLLMPALLRASAPRVVAISSIAHRRGRIDFADLQSERRYEPGGAYAMSKLADLMFAYELDRRAREAGSRLVSVAAHPGLSSTSFMANTEMAAYKVAAGSLAMRVLGQSAAMGALPGLYAATMPDVQGGQYWGPDGLLEFRGGPALARPSAHALDREVWRRLWTVSEELTGITCPALGPG